MFLDVICWPYQGVLLMCGLALLSFRFKDHHQRPPERREATCRSHDAYNILPDGFRPLRAAGRCLLFRINRALGTTQECISVIVTIRFSDLLLFVTVWTIHDSIVTVTALIGLCD